MPKNVGYGKQRDGRTKAKNITKEIRAKEKFAEKAAKMKKKKK